MSQSRSNRSKSRGLTTSILGASQDKEFTAIVNGGQKDFFDFKKGTRQANAKKAVAQLRRARDEEKSLEIIGHASKVMLATPPRPCTWIDLGRNKDEVHALSKDQISKRAQLCNTLRTVALKRVREAYCDMICVRMHTGPNTSGLAIGRRFAAGLSP